MSLLQHISTLRTRGTVEGQSDTELVKRVDRHVKRELSKRQPPLVLAKHLAPAVGLDSGTCEVRPIDALLRLARATALTLPASTASASRWWAVLRYLGAFDITAAGQLRINPASTISLRHNERRVFSEELGVGFGILLGERWCRRLGAGATGVVSVLDAGAALRDSSLKLGTVGRLVPDYVFRYTDRSRPGSSFFAALECKGTQDRRSAPKQLGHAMRQVDALRLDGAPLPGIGIATVTDTTQIVYRAVDPPGDTASLEFTDEELRAARQSEVLVREESGRVNVDKRAFLCRAVLFGDASLAAFCGDFATAQQWVPTSSRLLVTDEDVRLDTIDSGAWTGTTVRISTPSGDLEMFAGIDSTVLEALRSSSDQAVQVRQAEVADREESSREEADTNEARAIGSDGSMLAIRYRPRRL